MLIWRFIMVAALALVAGSASATCPYGIKNCQPAKPIRSEFMDEQIFHKSASNR